MVLKFGIFCLSLIFSSLSKALKEEKERTGEHILKGAEYLDSIPRKDKERVLKEYQELLNKNCTADI